MNPTDICRKCAAPVCKYYTESGHRINCPKHVKWLEQAEYERKLQIAGAHQPGCTCSQCTGTPLVSKRVPCVLLKEATGETKQCRVCKGSVEVKVFGCVVHGECTIERNVGLAMCVTCKDRKPS